MGWHERTSNSYCFPFNNKCTCCWFTGSNVCHVAHSNSHNHVWVVKLVATRQPKSGGLLLWATLLVSSIFPLLLHEFPWNLAIWTSYSADRVYLSLGHQLLRLDLERGFTIQLLWLGWNGKYGPNFINILSLSIYCCTAINSLCYSSHTS